MVEARATRVSTLPVLTPTASRGHRRPPAALQHHPFTPSSSMDIDDINNARSFAEDAAANLEDLQTTEFWLHMDEDIRIALCTAHAMCRTMAHMIEILMPTAASDGID